MVMGTCDQGVNIEAEVAPCAGYLGHPKEHRTESEQEKRRWGYALRKVKELHVRVGDGCASCNTFGWPCITATFVFTEDEIGAAEAARMETAQF